jgi:transposase
VFHDTAPALFGVEGLQVTDVQAGPGGTVEVRAVTDYPAAAACPDCGTICGRVHETVLARPRDVRRAADPVDLLSVKARRKCGNGQCPRKTFTEWVPQLPPRCRITARLREPAPRSPSGGITPAEAARHARVSWPVVHDAFAAAADPLPDQPAAVVAHLGIDEHRRGRARFAIDEQAGEYIPLADRWHTCFSGLSGQQGLLGQVQGRTADDAAYWLAAATAAWRDRIEIVRIDMCSINAPAIHNMLPHATLTVDLFHVVQLAVKAVGDVRRRVVRARYNDDIPELITLARTISRWEDEITAAVITGITNATSESLNRLAKLEARQAYVFRNPLNQRRRVRIACTRRYRRPSPTGAPRRAHSVTGRKPDPG